jgi:hypothetical protein
MQSRAALRDSLRSLAAPLRDGHAAVLDEHAAASRFALPIAFRPVAGKLVVTASEVPEIPIGTVIESFDGKPSAGALADAMELVSAGEHAKARRAAISMHYGPANSAAAVGVTSGEKTTVVHLPYRRSLMLPGPRPESLAVLRPGIHYVDLTRFESSAFQAVLPDLQRATAVVFDLRGYPTGDARDVLHYLATVEGESRWMRVPVFDRPFGTPAGHYESAGIPTARGSRECPQDTRHRFARDQLRGIDRRLFRRRQGR